MTDKKKITKMISTIIWAVVFFAIGALAAVMIALEGMKGAASSTPIMYLAMGNTLSGTVQDKSYDAGAHMLSLETNEFGTITVDCSTDMYNSCDIGDTVHVDFELYAHK